MSDELTLFRAITDFVNAPDWSTSRTIYDETPALHSDEALTALEDMMSAAEDEGDTRKRRILAIHHDLLVMAREVGADDAFQRISTPPDESLLQTLAAFVNAGSWDESQQVLADHPELLGMEARAAFEALMQTAQDAEDQKRFNLLQAHYELLKRVRDVGAEQAFAELAQPLDEGRLETIARFVYAGSVEGSRAVLEAHPELLDEETDHYFERLIRDAQRESETELAVLLTIHRDLLAQVRRSSIEEAFATQTLSGVPHDDAMQVVVDFVNADGIEGSRAVLEEHPELLGPEAAEAFNILIQTAEGQDRAEMAHHLRVYRDLLQVVREVGIEEAFRYVASPDNLLDMIVQMSIQALETDNAEMKTEWRGQLGQFNEQARTLGDEEMARLTDAIARLFLGGDPGRLQPNLEGAHAQAWARIAEAAQRSG